MAGHTGGHVSAGMPAHAGIFAEASKHRVHLRDKQLCKPASQAGSERGWARGAPCTASAGTGPCEQCRQSWCVGSKQPWRSRGVLHGTCGHRACKHCRQPGAAKLARRGKQTAMASRGMTPPASPARSERGWARGAPCTASAGTGACEQCRQSWCVGSRYPWRPRGKPPPASQANSEHEWRMRRALHGICGHKGTRAVQAATVRAARQARRAWLQAKPGASVAGHEMRPAWHMRAQRRASSAGNHGAPCKQRGYLWQQLCVPSV